MRVVNDMEGMENVQFCVGKIIFALGFESKSYIKSILEKFEFDHRSLLLKRGPFS